MTPEDDNSVYDKNDREPVTGPENLRHKEEEGGSDHSRKGGGSSSQKKEKSSSDDDGFYNPTGDEVRKHSAARANLALAEFSGAADSGLFNESDPANEKIQVLNPIKKALRDRRKVLAGGGAAAGVATIVIAGFLMLIPLKIEHIVTNLQNKFFASSNSAVEEDSQNMLKEYIVTKVLPAYKSCGTTVSKDCTPRNFGNNPVEGLYRTWSNNKLENKLATNYGIEFKYDRTAKTWRLKAPGTAPEGDAIGDTGDGLDREFNSRSEARSVITASMDDALQNETKWKKVMVRYQAGRLLEEKYGIKRCIMYCGKRDQLADNASARKKAFQLKLVQMVVAPLSEEKAAAFECLLNGCNPNDTESVPAEDGTTGEESGAPQSQLEQDMQSKAQERAATYSAESVSKMQTAVDDIREKGWSKYLLEKALEKVGLGAVASQAADAVPVVGAINQGATVIDEAHHAGPKLQKLGFLVNSAGDVRLFSMFRTYADEIHTGHVTADEVGSMVDALGPVAKDAEALGGTAGAEGSPWYQTLIDGVSKSKVSSKGYSCKGGSAVPASKLVCPEEVLGQSNGAADAVSSFLDSPPVKPVSDAAGIIHGITGPISNFFGKIFSAIPGVSNVSELISKILQPFFEDVINILLPNPFSDSMSGGRTFNLVAAGADVAGNDYAHIGLGGQAVSAAVAQNIQNQQEAEARQAFSQKPLFARMFSTDSQYSLVSRVAMDVPFGKQAAVQNGFASILNPIGTLSNGFGSMLSSRVSAADTAEDPVNVTQYAVIGLPSKPSQDWDQNCSDNPSFAYRKDNSWNEEASHTTDPNTGMPMNTTSNYCLTHKRTVGALGGKMDTSNLTSDDLGNLDGNGSTSSAGGGQVTGIEGNGSGKFTTDTSHPPYPGLDQMLARVKQADKDPGPFCANFGGCSGMCESAVEWAWLGHRGQYLDPFGNTNPNGPPGAGSAWAAAISSGHAHPKDRNPPVGALLIYNIPGDQYGHITIYLGNNLVFSTDFDNQGSVGIQPASHIETASWANSYIGWMDPYFSGKVGN